MMQAAKTRLHARYLRRASMRGKSIYTNMISLGLRFPKREAEIVETGTQVTNYAVQKAWVQLGLKQVTTTYVFHKWLTS